MARQRRSGGEAMGAGEADGGGTRPSESSAGPSFEEALAELEGVVAQLEAGDMPLEQALLAFESGVKLSRRCASTLDAAERRIEILMAGRAGGALRVEPFGGSRVAGDARDEALDVEGLEEIEALATDESGDDDPDAERRSR